MRSTIFLYVVAVILPIWVTVMLLMPGKEKTELATSQPYAEKIVDEAAKHRAQIEHDANEQDQARKNRDAQEQSLQARYRQDEQQRWQQELQIAQQRQLAEQSDQAARQMAEQTARQAEQAMARQSQNQAAEQETRQAHFSRRAAQGQTHWVFPAQRSR